MEGRSEVDYENKHTYSEFQLRILKNYMGFTYRHRKIACRIVRTQGNCRPRCP